MLTASDIMTRDVVTVTPDTEIVKVTEILLKNNYNGVPVLDPDGKIVGVITQSDIITQQKDLPVPGLLTILDGLIAMPSFKKIEKEVRKIAALKVYDAMTEKTVYVFPDTTIEKIASLIVDKGLYTLPVVENEKLVGIIGRIDLLRALVQ